MRKLFSINNKLKLLSIGFLTGIFALWMIGIFIHVPGSITSTSPVTAYIPNSNTDNSDGNVPKAGNTEVRKGNALPSAIPLYTPSTITAIANKKEVLSSPSPTYTVINFYGEELSINGWRINTESTEHNTTTINASGNGFTMSVSITSAVNNRCQFTIQIA